MRITINVSDSFIGFAPEAVECLIMLHGDTPENDSSLLRT